MNPSSSAAPTRTSRAAYARLAILAAILAVVAFGAYRLGLFELRDPARLAVAIDRARELRALPLLFVLGYIASTVVGLPATIFTLAGGAIFGTVLGSVLNWIGATVGAIGAYALARRLGSDAVRQLLGRHRGALEALSTRADFAALFRLRLIPIVPFNALNFSAGFVPAPFRGYVASTALGIIPGTIVYTYFADSLVAGVTGASEQALWHVAIAGALLIAISFVPSLVRRFRGGRATAAVTLGLVMAGADSQAQSASSRHESFDRLLRQHVVDGLVDYDAFARAPDFPRYLDLLATTDVRRLSTPERLALWINAYNAYTIQLINQHNERSSIRNINKTLGVLKLKGPWSERIARVGGRVYTLDEIEHEIIRKEFRDPRIHFALVCAAHGCPPLRSGAYDATNLDKQLDEQARRFLLASPAKNRVDVESRTVYLSPIFTWYQADFGGSAAALGRYLAHYYPDGPTRDLLMRGEFTVRETPYDWRLNRLDTVPAGH